MIKPSYIIKADEDWITCSCGVMVPEGRICTRCNRRTQGPQVENQTRKLLTGDQSVKR